MTDSNTEAMKQIEEAIEAQWGDRCPDFDADCACCQTWAEYDRLVSAALAHPGQVREIAIKPTEEMVEKFANVYYGGGVPHLMTDIRAALSAALALPLPVQESVPVGYVTKNELTKLRLGVSCVDLFGKVVPTGFEMVPLYLSPSPSIPEEKGGTAESVVGQEECAALIDTMLKETPWKDQMWSRGALMIAARAIRRGRHLTPSEKLANAFKWIDGDDDASPTEGQTVKEGE